VYIFTPNCPLPLLLRYPVEWASSAPLRWGDTDPTRAGAPGIVVVDNWFERQFCPHVRGAPVEWQSLPLYLSGVPLAASALWSYGGERSLQGSHARGLFSNRTKNTVNTTELSLLYGV
jgi:hypothetical protein